jgi:thiol-disulfide isomerase/thioredoxin
MTPRKKRIAIELALVLVVLVAVGAWRTRDHARGALPEMTLAALDGRELSLRNLAAGRPRVLAFFAPWCGVCKLTSQNLRWLAGAVGDRGVIAVASGWDDVAEVRRYVAENAPGRTVLLDAGDRLARRLGVTAYPSFYFVSAGGEIIESTVGYTTTLGLLLRFWLS